MNYKTASVSRPLMDFDKNWKIGKTRKIGKMKRLYTVEDEWEDIFDDEYDNWKDMMGESA